MEDNEIPQGMRGLVPLSETILKLNGFVDSIDVRGDYMFEDSNCRVFVQLSRVQLSDGIKQKRIIVIDKITKRTLEFTANKVDDYIPFYVRDLQQALNLCGVDKYIHMQ